MSLAGRRKWGCRWQTYGTHTYFTSSVDHLRNASFRGFRTHSFARYAGGMRRDETSPRAIRALTYLLELVSRDAGYLVHGVRGWATAPGIEEGTATWSVSELMAGQASSGRVTRVDVRAKGDPKPAWVYRITQKGVDVLANAVGAAPAGIDPPQGDPGAAVWIREGAWVAICVLRSVTDNPTKQEKVWVAGESGWRASRELTRLVQDEDEEAGLSPGRCFFSEDLAWLVRLGFAEQRVVAKTHVYRLTTAGAAVERLEWRDPDHA